MWSVGSGEYAPIALSELKQTKTAASDMKGATTSKKLDFINRNILKANIFHLRS